MGELIFSDGDDVSIPSRSMPDGSFEVFADGEWVQLDPPGTFAGERFGAVVALWSAAVDPRLRDRREVTNAIDWVREHGSLGEAKGLAEEAIDRLVEKGQLDRAAAVVARDYIAGV